MDDDVYDDLRRRAAEFELSVPELLQTKAARVAATPTIKAWLASPRRRSSGVGAETVVAALDELRGALC